MGAIDLKSDLHRILESIENEEVLRAIFDFLKEKENTEEGRIWKTLTEEQKSEVYQSLAESLDDNNLTSREEIKKKY